MNDFLIPVLIVDDEFLIRSLIRKSINWEELGFNIIGEAEDGEEAFQLAQDLQPRLMILDINIPFINGLDLAGRIRQRFPFINIIILTGYEDFQYAKTAIRAGVLNYLLKPINPEEMREILQAARKRILIEERNRLVSIQGQIKQEPPAPGQLRERFLQTLISTETHQTDQEILDRFKFFHISLVPGSFVVCLVENLQTEAFQEDSYFEGFEVFQDSQGRIVLLGNENPRISRIKSQNYYTQLRALLREREKSGAAVTIGISRIVEKPEDICKAYVSAEQALDEQFFRGNNRIFIFEEIEHQLSSITDLPVFALRTDLLLYLRSANLKRAKELVSDFLARIAEKSPPRPYADTACIEILSLINEFLEENGLSLQDLHKKKQDLYAIIAEFKVFSSLVDWILGLIETSLEKIESSGSCKTNKLVHKARKFIDLNFQKAFLSVEQIADYVFVSPSYMSSIFKKELGISIVEYLTDCRQKKAKEIMDELPLTPIGEVAKKVGYSDPYYFSKCFRKCYGLSPSQYLRNKKTFL